MLQNNNMYTALIFYNRNIRTGIWKEEFPLIPYLNIPPT